MTDLSESMRLNRKAINHHSEELKKWAVACARLEAQLSVHKTKTKASMGLAIAAVLIGTVSLILALVGLNQGTSGKPTMDIKGSESTLGITANGSDRVGQLEESVHRNSMNSQDRIPPMPNALSDRPNKSDSNGGEDLERDPTRDQTQESPQNMDSVSLIDGTFEIVQGKMKFWTLQVSGGQDHLDFEVTGAEGNKSGFLVIIQKAGEYAGVPMALPEGQDVLGVPGRNVSTSRQLQPGLWALTIVSNDSTSRSTTVRVKVVAKSGTSRATEH